MSEGKSRQRRGPTLIVFAVGLAAGGAGALLLVRARAPVPASATPGATSQVVVGEPSGATSSTRSEPTATAGSPAAAADRNMRARIRAEVAKVLAEGRRGHELDAWLDALAERARQQGQVTALEVQTGLAAIDAAYPGDPERDVAFVRRMEKLSRALGQAPLVEGLDDARSDKQAPQPAAMLALEAVRRTPPGAERDRLTPKAIAAIRRLPAADQDEALLALDRATAPATPPLAAPSLDRILSDLARTTDADTRRTLVQTFLQVASALPTDEQARRLRDLDAATSISPRIE